MRKAEDRDARLKKIVPTEKAEKVREHVLMNIDRTEKIIRQGIPDEKMAVCIETLELISANLFEDEKCCTEKQKTAAAAAVRSKPIKGNCAGRETVRGKESSM